MHMSDADLVARMFILPVALTLDPFAPLLVLGICLRMGWIDDPVLTGPAFAGFADPAFLFLTASLYTLHALADKFPPLGHLLDAIGVVVKPIAAALAGFWLANALSTDAALPWYAVSLAVLGIPATFGLQLARTKVRAGLSAMSFGFFHPIVSGSENILGLLIALALTFHPIAGLFLIVLVFLALGWLLLRLVKCTVNRIKRVRGIPA